MRVLFLGDVVGRSGRKAVLDNLPQLKLNLRPDFIIVNGENAAGGFGITPTICDELFNAGVDAITSGNHAWDQRDIIEYIDQLPTLPQPLAL